MEHLIEIFRQWVLGIIGIMSVFSYWTNSFYDKNKKIEDNSILCMKSVVMISTCLYFYILIRYPGKINDESGISIQPFVLALIIFTLLYSVLNKIWKKIPDYNKVKNIVNFIAVFGFSLGLIIALRNTITFWINDAEEPFFHELMYWTKTFWFIVTGSVSLWLRRRVQKREKSGVEKYLILFGFVIIMFGIYYQVHYYGYYRDNLSGLLIQIGLIIFVTLIPFSISIFLLNNRRQIEVFSCSLLIIYMGIVILSVLKPFGIYVDFDQTMLSICFIVLLIIFKLREPYKYGKFKNEKDKKGKVMTDTTKILFLSADPKDRSRLRLGEEVRKIQMNLKLAKHRDKLLFKQESAITTDTLMQALLDESPDIVHFSGHGQQEGIIIEDELGKHKIINTNALSKLFELFKSVKCVILNSCYSETQAQAIKLHIPFVIGMKSAVCDETAISFSTGFYKAIGAGKDIPFAFEMGLAAIELDGGISADNVAVLLT
ncbi:MAG: CHAT domain-containing protein [Desulfobacterales bacterium]|nr:CHAT domain-containing protein [Desulfobacterales bacterium]